MSLLITAFDLQLFAEGILSNFDLHNIQLSNSVLQSMGGPQCRILCCRQPHLLVAELPQLARKLGIVRC